MPLFEVDAERPVLVHPAAPSGGFGTDAQRVVDGNLDGLLGEQIFPVAQGLSLDEPHLLALDAAGLPVVIDVVSELTEETLTRALNHAGEAGQLTRVELAARYANGPAAFHQDVASFYDNVPLTRSQSAARTTGARLIIICQSAADGILDALDFLRQPGSPVAVLRLGVVKTEDGRRFVDVSPLALGRELAGSRQPDPIGPGRDFAEGVAVGRALTGKVPVVSRRAVAATVVAGREPTRSPRPTGPFPRRGVAAEEPTLRSRAERRRAQEAGSVTREVKRAGDETAPSPVVAAKPSATPDRDTPDRPSGRLTADASPELAAHGAAGSSVPATGGQEAHVPAAGELVPGPDDDPDLIHLARSLRYPARLVWSRPRRGQRFEAVLHPDGVIEVADGARFRHPDLAAVAVSGTMSADGWSVWRFGEDGPSLMDAFRACHS